jgi:hypothetical protein
MPARDGADNTGEEDAMVTLLVTVAIVAFSTLVGLTLAWGGLAVLFWSIEAREAQRPLSGPIGSARVPSAS